MSRKRRPVNPAEEAYLEGMRQVFSHPLFGTFRHYVDLRRCEGNRCPENEWAVVTSEGVIEPHPTRRGTPRQWAWVVAHGLLHLGLDHFREHADPRAWNLACDEVVASFLLSLGFGAGPEGYSGPPEGNASADEEKRYAYHRGKQSQFRASDLVFTPGRRTYLIGPGSSSEVDWRALLAEGMRQAAAEAVATAAGHDDPKRVTRCTRARDWFITSYPLLGSLAASFEIVEDPRTCEGLGIQIAAVDELNQTIFLNSAVPLQEGEVRFVMAHEFLHAGLRHGARCAGRDPYLWNVACDFVINGWLIEMGVGDPPQLGLLHDPDFHGMSAEQVYDQIACEARRYRLRGTFAGAGVPDILQPRDGSFCDKDDFFRRCLGNGLECMDSRGRGLLPMGLVEAIRALAHPPLPWDVELARWFDEHFPVLERRRTFARPSRRQASTPDIPRPRWILPTEDARTFGVVLDTSGSMDTATLAKGLGAIASYAMSRDVPACRVVFCDAHPYDQGYIPPDAIAGRVKVRGRGGTVLQPAIDLLERAPDFPRTGPILIITDGQCDRLNLSGRKHAYLMPQGAHLPFVARGEVFRIR